MYFVHFNLLMMLNVDREAGVTDARHVRDSAQAGCKLETSSLATSHPHGSPSARYKQ